MRAEGTQPLLLVKVGGGIIIFVTIADPYRANEQ